MLQAHLLRESVPGRAQPEAEAESDHAEHVVSQSELHVTRKVAPIDFDVLVPWYALQFIDAPKLRVIHAEHRNAVQVAFVDAGRDAVARLQAFEALFRVPGQPCGAYSALRRPTGAAYCDEYPHARKSYGHRSHQTHSPLRICCSKRIALSPTCLAQIESCN